MKHAKTLLTVALLATVIPALQGCFPVVAGGVAIGVLTVTDRRTVGIQTEDETIEWKVQNRISEKYGDKVHVNATSYNRKVLLTGEVPTDEAKAVIAEIASKVDNVSGIYNELQVAGISSLSSRSSDTYITSKVKTRFIDANKFAANHVKVVTEASVVYLMGIVNEREAQAAIQVARTTAGVRKVINVLDVVSDSEAKRLDTLKGNTQNNPPAAKSTP